MLRKEDEKNANLASKVHFRVSVLLGGGLVGGFCN